MNMYIYSSSYMCADVCVYGCMSIFMHALCVCMFTYISICMCVHTIHTYIIYSLMLDESFKLRTNYNRCLPYCCLSGVCAIIIYTLLIYY
jgi:hypothetical protein